MIFNRKIVFFISFFSFLLSVDNLQHIKNITSLINSTSIELLDDNRLLIGTTGGIYTSDFLGDNFTDYTENLQYANINTIAKDEENNTIWLGGSDGNIQVLDNDLNLKHTIDYVPFTSIEEIVFYGDYAFAIASYENQNVIVQYAREINPRYLNYFKFNNFLIEAENNGNQWFDWGFDSDVVVNVIDIYDIYIAIDWLYLATNEGVLRVDLTNYNNNLLLLLDWDLYDSSCTPASFIDNWWVSFEQEPNDFNQESFDNPLHFWLSS